VLDGYTYQDVPFENVVEAVTPERDITRHPLFQVQFALQHVTLQNLQMAGLTVKPYQLHNGTTKFDLSLFAWEEGDGLMTSIEYNADLFAGETVSRILDHLHTLLEHIAADPTRSWVTLPLLTAQEEQKIVHDWNATAVESGRAEDVQTLFERQVEQAPAAPALVYGSEQVSYQELDQRANQLAHYLQQSGVKADTLVGLYLERSPELIIAVLAVLKAGGAYVPLDPSYPAERLVAIAENAHLQTVVTSDQLESKLPENVQRVSIQSLHIAEQSTSRPERMVDPGNLAYVIYTSGSTGTPKGVMISHRGLSNYLNWAIAHYAVSTGNGSVVHSPLAFDLTVTSLFPALLTGKHVVLVPEEEAVEQLVQTVRQGQHFSLLKLTPAHVEILKQFIAPEELAASANALVIGGEALHAESLQAWRQFAPQTRLINEYGPTEAVVGCCIYEIAPGDANTGEVPIGRPIANTCLYVLDKHLCPVPVGIPGELYIGGVGVARGYINQPELTAERFIPDMFHSIPGSRCYKTGDQVRYRPDGVLEFLGRFDHQVKVRGYRIELGEIEVALLRHPAVSECVVTVQGDNSADKILVAYVVSELTQAQAAAQLSAHVREMLPTYMLPSTFVVLKALPLTTNGKVDRQALPVPTLDDAALAAAPTPLTPVAEVIEGIWSRLLQRPHIGLHENFFTCGGHSLLASRVIAQIRAVFQIELPIRTLFEAPTVAQLAQRVEAVLRQSGSAQPDLPLLPVERPQDIPLALAQQRLWFLEQLELTEPLYNVPLAVRLGGPLDLPALEASVLDLVQRHESLRTTFAEGPHGPVQHIHDHLPPRWLYYDLRYLHAEVQTRAVKHLFAQEQQERFDLRQGPLLRVQVVCIDDQEHVLLVTLHHIIADAWSLQVLLRDWGLCYAARCRKEDPSLTPLPVQYVDYALWQRAWMDGERMKEQEEYWRKQLQGAPELLELPTDRLRGSTSHHRGANELFVLSDELIAGLRTLSQ
nr:amino acid adenylation domain-containing protein [Ktedonobacteraceae bacterium]